MLFKTNEFKVFSDDRISNLQLKLVVVSSIYIHTIYINFFASIKRIIIMKFMNSICVEKGSSKICEQYACVIQTKIISCQQRKLKFCICINSSAIILPYVIPLRRQFERTSLIQKFIFFIETTIDIFLLHQHNSEPFKNHSRQQIFIRRLGIIIIWQISKGSRTMNQQ